MFGEDDLKPALKAYFLFLQSPNLFLPQRDVIRHKILLLAYILSLGQVIRQDAMQLSHVGEVGLVGQPVFRSISKAGISRGEIVVLDLVGFVSRDNGLIAVRNVGILLRLQVLEFLILICPP